MGVTQGTISRWEKGKQQPDMHALMKLAAALGIEGAASFALGDEEALPAATDYVETIPIVGGIAWDKWREAPHWEKEFQRTLYLPIPWEWRAYRLQAYVVEDDSIDYHFKPGSVVVVATFDANRLSPEPGDLVAYAEKNEDGLFAVAIREYLKSSATPGRAILATASQAGSHTVEVQAPEIERASAGRDLASIGFLGVVVAAMSVVAPNRLPPRERRAPPAPPPLGK